MAYKIEYYYASHLGRLRKANQDNFICIEEYLSYRNNGTDGICSGEITTKEQPVFGVFDGMGGEECGEMASYLAAKTIAELDREGDPEKALENYCRNANQKICEYTKEQGLNSMGTTAAILWMHKKKIYLCNLGDSRIFQMSDGVLQQISYDHVSVAMPGKKPPLLQNLGISEEEMIISPYLASGEYQKGDIYLISSDGLTDMVEEDEIARILNGADRKAAAEELLQKALDNGGKDNISFVILYIDKEKIKWFHPERK